jgi:hypothetical protein
MSPDRRLFIRLIWEVCSWKAKPLEMRPIEKPRRQRRIGESSRSAVFTPLEAKPLPTGLSIGRCRKANEALTPDCSVALAVTMSAPF